MVQIDEIFCPSDACVRVKLDKRAWQGVFGKSFAEAAQGTLLLVGERDDQIWRPDAVIVERPDGTMRARIRQEADMEFGITGQRLAGLNPEPVG